MSVDKKNIKVRGKENIILDGITVHVSEGSQSVIGNNNTQTINNFYGPTIIVRLLDRTRPISVDVSADSVDKINEAYHSCSTNLIDLIIKNVTSTVSLTDEQIKRLKLLLKQGLKSFVGCPNRTSIMADSIINSCPENNKKYLESVRTFAKGAKEKFVVFLSAITKKKNQGKEDTLEYKVARRLKDKLKKENIGVFWWEDDSIKNYGWNVSTKIAMGLAFSSIFVGLAFDTVSKTEEGDYVYNCLLEGDQAYKTPNFFKYEVDTYFKFAQNKANAKKFVKDIVDVPQFDEVLPQNRKLTFFTYGKPSDYSQYPMFNNREDSIFTIDENATEKQICKEVLSKILELYAKQQQELRPDIWNAKDDTEYGDYEQKVQELFRVAKNSPSDYYLEYAVIDEKGNDAADHFMFFLEKTYIGGKPTMSLNMVVNDWNDAFCDYLDEKGQITEESKALLKKAYGLSTDKQTYHINEANALACYNKFSLELPSRNDFLNSAVKNSSNVTTWRYYNRESNKISSYTTNGGKAEICSPAESLRAQIIFSEPHAHFTDIPQSRTFDVTVNVVKKEIIKYTTKLIGRNLIKIDFSKPVPRKVGLKLVYSNKHIPCFSSTKERETYSDEFFIEANCRSSTRSVAVSSEGTNFRLCISKEEKEWEMQYPFVIFQYTDSKFSKKDFRKRVFVSGSERTCPYCARSVHKIKGFIESVGNNASKTKKIKRKHLFKQGALGCGGGYKKDKDGRIIQGNAKRLVCLNNKLLQDDGGYFLLPKNYENEYSTNAIVALIGAAGAGKSTFISRFFNIGLNEVGEKVMINGLEIKKHTANENIVTSIKSGQVAAALEAFATIEENKDETTSNVDANTVLKRFNKWRSYYAISPYSQFVKRTTESRTTTMESSITDIGSALRQLPFIVSVKRNVGKSASQVAFYDVPGADLYVYNTDGASESRINIEDGYFAYHHANGLILFINDGRGETRTNDLDEASAIMNGYIQQYQALRSRKIDKDNLIDDVALAVVLCQFDRIETNFDLNSVVRATAPPLNAYSYVNSELPEYTDKCSSEIETYLKSCGNFETLKKQLDLFEHKKFFAVSSIGHSEAISVKPIDGMKFKQTRFISQPRNMEYVFAWLLYQTGIID
ncbi:MAG: hypothetical protein NC099_03340 [Corallococcus sp.]|nr:hypothetical protein [Corallococcus sp.]